jgi:hypothetical protein
MISPVRPVVWFAEPSLRAPGEKIAAGRFTGTAGKTVSSAKDFADAVADGEVIAFVDQAVMPEITRLAKLPPATIVVCKESLPLAITWLQPHPWVSHVVSATMLDHPLADEHFKNVLATIKAEKPRLLDWLGSDVAGRRIRLSHASRRVERLERMGEYLSSNGVGARTIEQLRDAAEELLTNAFYDAPVAAGAIKDPISRSFDVALPDKYACDLAYGARGDLAIVRVKDPFGSLSRKRLVEVLVRCSATDMTVEVDESMGGAGLGMWRVFSNASFVAISVVKHSHTEILVGIAKRAPGPRPFAFHLFFAEGGKPRYWSTAKDESINPSLNHSVLLELKDKI